MNTHFPKTVSAIRTGPGLRILVNVFLFLLLLSSGAGAAGNDADRLEKLLSDIQNRVDNTTTVQARFEQERNLSIFARPILFSGRMALSRPDRLRWENLDPIPSVLIFAGDRGIRCNDDAPPVTFEMDKDPVMRMIAEQIWTWVDSDYARLRDKYDISLTGEQEIRLVPRTGEFVDVIESIRVTFDERNLQPRTIHIRENGGDSTTIRFAEYRLNEPVADSLFTTCYPQP